MPSRERARKSPSNHENSKDSKDKRETIVQRRERVLGQKSLRYVENLTQKATGTSGDKRRGQILQAQRIHRQRTLDYIEELENEIFRLRETKAAVDNSQLVLDVQHNELDQVVAVQHKDNCQITLQMLIRCLNSQVGPGLFMKRESVDVQGSDETTSIDEWDPRISESIPFVQEPKICTPPRVGLEIHDALTQMLLLNFSESIAPTLVAFDGPKNGYNSLLLPLANDDELVRNTVLAASATHLQFKRPQLAKIAMNFQMTAIEALSNLTGTGSDAGGSPEVTLAAVVVLIINDMMKGGADFLILLGMAKSWIVAMRGKDESRNVPLRSFLQQQIQMFEHFAQPLLSERSFFAQQNNMYTIFAALESAIKQACAIYTYHITIERPPDDIETLLKELKNTTLLIPRYTPGESGLAWVYFIAAAESVSPLHRTFFARRLMGVYERGSFLDVTTSFDVLHQIWNHRSLGGNWTQSLMQMPLVFR